MTIKETSARQAFAAACAHLASYRPADPRQPPAVTFNPSGPLRAEHSGRTRPESSTDGVRGKACGPLHDALRVLSSGTCSARELVEHSLAQVRKWDGELGAFAELTAHLALADADRRDRQRADGAPCGPLHGIPLTVKDVIDVAGVPTRAGSAAYHHLPTADADAVARLRAAGAIILGKTTTHEFALGVTTPQSRNPHDVTRIPGGSSGGSAIAVATGMGLGSIGTDTRASIRVPAALSGVVALKPTYGAVPATGIVPLSWTMDHVAPMAASVADVALLLDVLTGCWGTAAYPGLVREVRVGVCETGFAGADPAVDRSARAAVARLADLGCQVQPADRPTARDLDDANSAGLIISRVEAAAFHRAAATSLDDCWDETADQLHEAGRVPAIDYIDAQRLRADLTRSLLAQFDAHDVLAMPTTTVTAPPVVEAARYLLTLSRNTIPWSLVGFPALTLPCGRSPDGLPVGLQLIAPPHHEATLVTVGAALEQAF
ncbi:MAG: amidase [Egibacteraceae bacterium]